jgi:DNA-binding helix-hairpin-helix protein with protein kinase domain
MPAARNLCDYLGRPVELGPPLASGGEGTVHPVAGDAALLAKVYHRPPAAATIEKLRWMVRQASPELGRFAAWPTATLHDGPGGLLVGFLMPRFAGGRPIHTLYSPAHRRTAFPFADWAFLVHTAMNAAIAFDAVHAGGHVVGDVNQSNVLVSERALVYLIDCDSFQVQGDGRVFPCEVGVSPFTPPELQGRNLREVLRTVDHDRFGLAVLIFHLLFMGRHPFAGRFLGRGEMPLEQAIQECRFVYGKGAAAVQMAPPPGALPLDVVSPELAELFERALARGSERDGARPTAAEWQAALAAFERGLRTCTADSGHKIPAHRAECPWCAVMRDGGPNFFLGVSLESADFAPDMPFLTRTWERIEHIAYQPPLPPRLPRVAARPPTPKARQVRFLRGAGRLLGLAALLTAYLGMLYLGESWRVAWPWFAVALVLGVGYFVLRRSPTFNEAARRREALQTLRQQMQAALVEWRQVADAHRAEFQRRKRKLQEWHEQYRRLPALYEAERPQAAANREAYFRDQFLRTCFLSEHRIDGIGANRAVLLASHGIETAADVDGARLGAVRGVGPVLTRNLLVWKKKLQAQFQFDPNAVVPERDARAVLLKYKQLEEGLRGRLRRGAEELEALAGRTQEQLQPIHRWLETLTVQVAQAEADVEALA